MLCRHCGKKIPLLKRLSDAEFCSVAHRSEFMRIEEAAAISRLMQHGSNLAVPAEGAPQPAPKAKGSKKKQSGKDEIPAPLAGLVPEPASRPKVKRKALSRPELGNWELARELPQSPLVIQARRLDVAGGVPIEAHPARGRHGAHDAVLDALPTERLEALEAELPVAEEWAPLVSIQGPGAVAPEAGMRVVDPCWQGSGAGHGFSQAGPGLRAAELAGPALAAVPAARAVAAAGPAVEVRAEPRQATGERCAPKMHAEPQPHVRTAGESAGPALQAAEAGLPDGGEPAPCGLVALLLGVVGAAGTVIVQRLEWACACESRPRAPRAAMAPVAAMRRAWAMAGVEQAAGAPVIAVQAGAQRALRPKRRLIGPRVRNQASRMMEVAGAPLVLGGELPAAKGPQAWLEGKASPLAAAVPDVRTPALWREDGRDRPELAGAALRAIPGLRALRASGSAEAQAAPAWRAGETVIPAAGLGVEEPMICTVEAAMAEPEAEGPPLFDRLLPIFASRGLKSREQACAGAGFGAGDAWVLALGRQPAMRGARLALDHADGSGSRGAVAVVKPRRPWHSIQLPTLHLASWRSAPADLKWIMMALPMILVIALYSFLPTQTKNSVETASGTASEPTVLSQRVKVIRTAIMERAAIKLADDFRSGLGAWQGQPGWAQSWTYNSANYAVPGQLALYGPSLGLRDYVFSFLGQVDRRSINWVVRARDERNYLAMRIVMTRSGPLPAASLVRYAVVDGKAGNQTVLPLPIAFRDGTMQQVEVTVAGETITTRVMGQIVDSFTERKLDVGGVGFYSPKGDKALLRWMLVTHQYDYIGRLCALLAPHSVMRHDARRME